MWFQWYKIKCFKTRMKMTTWVRLCIMSFSTLAIFVKPSLPVKYKKRALLQSPANLTLSRAPVTFQKSQHSLIRPRRDSQTSPGVLSLLFTNKCYQTHFKPITSNLATPPLPYCSVLSPRPFPYFSFDTGLLWKEYVFITDNSENILKVERIKVIYRNTNI